MTKQKPSSLQDVLKRRQQEIFVGREEQVNLFGQNLGLALDDPDRRFIFNVFGQGGVGKTWLLGRFRQMAERAGAVTAWTNEVQEDVPAAMGRIAEQFAGQGHELKSFSDRYRVYRQRRQELEADPEAPQGLPGFVGKTLVKGGIRLARRAPIGGVAFDFIDEDALATQGGEWLAYVARKIGNKDEVNLVQNPVEVLTPLLLEDLQKVAAQQLIALFFDTYEHTGVFLDTWLRALLEEQYGPIPLNIALIVAGRHELDKNRWSPYEGLLARLDLERFTGAEARQYLARKGVTEERVTEVILALSGRLPLLVATLAAKSPTDPAHVGDPSGTAVERFLQWTADPQQRQIAVDAALPRQLNHDVLATMAGEGVEMLFNWLKTMPFVQEQAEGWVYHSVVRPQMLRHKRREAPQSWAALHGKLAEHYVELRDKLGLAEEAGQLDPAWQAYTLEALYHQLCQNPQKQLSRSLNGFLRALKAKRSFARRWAETMRQAGDDTGHAEMKGWGQRLVEGLQAYDDDRYEIAIGAFTALLERADLEVQWRAVALDWRGFVYYVADQDRLAVADLSEALDLAPEEAEYWKDRGLALASMERFDEALADFDRAIELDPEMEWAIAHRGYTYRLLERYDEALADFDRAIELDPEYGWAIASRGETYHVRERYEAALADFDRAIELNPEIAWTFAHRAESYRLLACYDRALADFDRAIELDSRYAWAIAHRGETCRLLERYDEALADFDRALELSPEMAWAIAHRGETYQSLLRSDEALADFDRAIELDPKYAWAIASRGLVNRSLERYDEALADFDRAIELDPEYSWAIAGRGETYRLLERYDEAITDFDRAIELDPKDAWAIASRGQVQDSLERYDEALADFDRAIEIDPGYAWAVASRGQVYRSLERYAEALADFDRALELDPEGAWVTAHRGETYRLMERFDEALADFDRAIELAPKYGWAVASRGQVYHALERYAEALADFDRAIEVKPEMDWAIAHRGFVNRLLERYDEALADFDRALALDPEDDWYTYHRGLTHLARGATVQARADFRLAIDLARRAYEADPQKWRNSLNLAVYYLAAGEAGEAQNLYRAALAAPAPEYNLREASHDLADFLRLFPDHTEAREVRHQLRRHLEAEPASDEDRE